MASLTVEVIADGGLALVKRDLATDVRGMFSRLFDATSLGDHWPWQIKQINLSHTHLPGALRGLHFQFPPFDEAKLVTCIRGQVLDVAIDIRPDSQTFLQSFAQELSDENGISMLIPPGFAHGFQTLSPDVELIYVHSGEYRPDHESGLDALDPALAIPWRLPVSARSARDVSLPPVSGLDLTRLSGRGHALQDL